MVIPRSGKRGSEECKSLREMGSEPPSGLGSILEFRLMDQSDHEIVNGSHGFAGIANRMRVASSLKVTSRRGSGHKVRDASCFLARMKGPPRSTPELASHKIGLFSPLQDTLFINE